MSKLRHPNIVAVKGICKDKYTLLMEFLQFDFRLFGVDLQVTSLAELLSHFDKCNCEDVSEKCSMELQKVWHLAFNTFISKDLLIEI